MSTVVKIPPELYRGGPMFGVDPMMRRLKSNDGLSISSQLCSHINLEKNDDNNSLQHGSCR